MKYVLKWQEEHRVYEFPKFKVQDLSGGVQTIDKALPVINNRLETRYFCSEFYSKRELVDFYNRTQDNRKLLVQLEIHTNMHRYRKKPVEIEAIQFTGTNYTEIEEWIRHF